MNIEEIVNECLDDRVNSFNGKKPSFIKALYIDLFIKELILLLNSLGKKNYNDINIYYFVDEVKNSNMSNNLQNTYKLAKQKNYNTRFLKFYSLAPSNHIKIGILKPSLLGLVLLTMFPIILLIGFFKREHIFKFIAYGFMLYLKCLDFAENKIFLMTDHHFFSSIIAMLYSDNSYVLQHGLILDQRFYLPIRAGHFCAWGKHSSKLLKNDTKVMITGTMKFHDLKANKKNSIKKIMYCISSLNNEIVTKKINMINNVAEKLGYEFIVKCHPGSMFNVDYWESIFRDKNIIFYKEEKICDLDFDIAVSENSTVNIDLALMNIPFVIFDDINGYFAEYKYIIPSCNSEYELLDVMTNIKTFDFNNINRLIIEKELNNNLFSLF